MAAFCVPPHLAEKLKQAAQAGSINIEKMYTMSTDDRRRLFEKYVDPETAKGVNVGFEKAMASEQQSAIGNWVKKTFSSGEKAKPEYKDIVSRVNDLQKQGLLTPESEKAFLQDLVSEKLGARITTKEAGDIVKLSEELEKHSEEKGQRNGHTFETHSMAYYDAKQNMDKYVQSLTPTHNLRVFTSTIGRGAMLLSVKSPLVNVVSNSVNGFLEAARRRIEQRKFNGFNSDYANEYRKFALDVYKKTGYDLSRFQSFEGEHKITGEDITHSQGKGAFRAVGRFFEDVAFNKLQSIPDVAFASFHFVDSANLASSVLALKEGAGKERALAILKDAFKEAPDTKEGQYVRAQAEADALYATFTNKTLASDVALKLRGIANTATGDLRLGDITDPFVKTPANVLAAGLDYSGATVTAKVSMGIIKALNDVAHRQEFDKTNFADINRYMIRAGMGLTFAYVVSQMIKPQDFIGQYPTTPTEQKLFDLQKGVANSIKIGDKWVSLDYLSVLGAPLLGFLYAKKYGDKGAVEAAYQYTQGIKSTLQNLPGINTLVQAYNYIKMPPSSKTTAADAGMAAGKAALGAITSRIIPGIVNDLAKMSDPFDRETDKNNPFAAAQKQIPGLREGIPGIIEGLPVKNDLFGDPVQTENWMSTLLFGSRVKTANDSPVVKELVSLDKENALPSITDVSRSSKVAKDLRSQIGEEKFHDAMLYFGNNLKQNMEETIKSPEYTDQEFPEGKKLMLDKVKQSTFKDMLDTYGYEKPVKE